MTEWMWNLYGVRACHKTINNRHVARGYHTRKPRGRPYWQPIIAESAWHGHRGRRIWPSSSGSTSSLATTPDSNFILSMAGHKGASFARGIARRIEYRQVGGGSIHVWGAFHNNAKSLLCHWIGTRMGWCTGTFYRTPWGHLQGSISMRTSFIKTTMLCLITPG